MDDSFLDHARPVLGVVVIEQWKWCGGVLVVAVGTLVLQDPADGRR